MENVLKVLKLPTVVTINSRISSINNAFVNGIIPVLKPSPAQIKNLLDQLELSDNDVRCAYCGAPANQWDHINPIICDKAPTGYITEIDNLIPCCQMCNSSKGGKNWHEWITSDAERSPKSRHIANLAHKIKLIEQYIAQTHPHRIDMEDMVGIELWKTHWENRDKLVALMKECHKKQTEIRAKIKACNLT